MTETLPEPLTPADCDLRSFPFMELHVQRLLRSEWWLRALTEQPEACGAAVNLWAVAWHELPAGSLPDSDFVLWRMSGLERKTWDAVRERILAPWVKCSDGRIYHPVVSEIAAAAHGRKHKAAEAGRKGNAIRWGSQPDRDPIATRDEGDQPAVASRSGLIAKGKEQTGPELNGKEAQPRARELDPEVRAIIAEFDAARVAAHGPQRARLAPHPTDTVIASRWVASGLTAAILSPMFHARHRAKAQAGQEPIDMLRFLERAVAELGSPTPSQPQPPAGNIHTHPAAELEQRKAAYTAALTAHKAGQRDRPNSADYGLAYNRETQGIMLAGAPRPPIPAPQDAQPSAPEGPPERVA